MKKEEINIDGLYKIKKEDLKRCADVAAQAFLDDESSKFLLSSNLTYNSLYNYYLAIHNAAYNKMHMFAESANIDGFIIIAPIKNAELSFWDCVKTGGLKSILSLGLGVVLRSLEYERNCIKVRKKIASSDAWYVFQFGVCPSKQGCGLGSRTIRPFLNWLDSQKINCYLETQKACNVNMYNHFGFSLKSVDTLPKKKAKQFAMLRSI
jgi:GNAT superfamily N-acetyltransferase